MAQSNAMMAAGMHPQMIRAIQGTPVTVAAAGTTRADATALTSDLNNCTTVGSGAGVILPAIPLPGDEVVVANAQASNALKVYAAGSQTINGVAGSTGISIAASKGGVFRMCDDGLAWLGIYA